MPLAVVTVIQLFGVSLLRGQLPQLVRDAALAAMSPDFAQLRDIGLRRGNGFALALVTWLLLLGRHC